LSPEERESTTLMQDDDEEGFTHEDQFMAKSMPLDGQFILSPILSQL